MALRAVAPGERKPRKKMTVVEAAKGDDHRELLRALRARLAAAIESPSCPAVAVAALSRQLTLISKELSIMDTVDGEDALTVAAGTPDESWSAI
jgi:hypothetical protein